MKVVIRTLRPGKRKTSGVRVKRVRNSEGEMVTVRALDAGSRTFGSELRGVFASNVTKARKANKAVAGVRDRRPAKH
jgi:hypothetical protein